MLSPVMRAFHGAEPCLFSPSSAQSRSNLSASTVTMGSNGGGPPLQYFSGPDNLWASFTNSDVSSAVKSSPLTPLNLTAESGRASTVGSNGLDRSLLYFTGLANLSASFISDDSEACSLRRSASTAQSEVGVLAAMSTDSHDPGDADCVASPRPVGGDEAGEAGVSMHDAHLSGAAVIDVDDPVHLQASTGDSDEGPDLYSFFHSKSDLSYENPAFFAAQVRIDVRCC